MTDTERMQTDIRWLIFFTMLFMVAHIFSAYGDRTHEMRLDALEQACGIEQVER